MRVRNRLVVISTLLLITSIWIGTSATVAHAEVVIGIDDEVLDKAAAKRGPITESGAYDLEMDYFCGVRCTKKKFGICYQFAASYCSMTVYTANWNASVSNINFSIAPSGITFTASTNVTYGPCNSNKTANGEAFLNIAGDNIVFGTTRVVIPLECEMFGIGIDVTTLDRTLPYSFSVPLLYANIKNTSEAGGEGINTKLMNKRIERQTGRILLKTSPIFW